MDYFSNFFEVDVMTSTTAKQMITCLKRNFGRYGIPKSIVSDFGPQMMSTEFQRFVTKSSFTHITSSPGHHSANGKAESAVKRFKNMLKKTLETREDQYLILL